MSPHSLAKTDYKFGRAAEKMNVVGTYNLGHSNVLCSFLEIKIAILPVHNLILLPIPRRLQSILYQEHEVVENNNTNFAYLTWMKRGYFMILRETLIVCVE